MLQEYNNKRAGDKVLNREWFSQKTLRFRRKLVRIMEWGALEDH